MHEYALTDKIIRTSIETANKNKAKAVSSIHLVVGDTAGILIESIQMYFDLIAEGTLASGAVLQIKTVASQMYCSRCKKNFVRKRCSFDCPDCGEAGTPTEIGKEFYIEKIELEV